MQREDGLRVDLSNTGQVQLHGVIDERADLHFLATLHGHVKVGMRGVRRINSFGVRAWLESIRKVPGDTSLEFIECPPPVIDQINMVAGFLGRGRVTSFFAPMTCERCSHAEDHLFSVEDCRRAGGKLPHITCPRCGQPMEVDDLEEQYLLFVREG
jgi:hypothetical protein